MSLYEDDGYLCELPEQGIFMPMLSLCTLYQPLIGYEAVALYGTLWAEGMESKEVLKHERLCRLTRMNIDVMESARKKLEQYGLVRSYYQKEKEQYLYRLFLPLNAEKFFSHYVYGLQYKNLLGLSEYERSRMKYGQNKLDTQGYKEVSAKLDKASLAKITETDMQEFLTAKAEDIKQDESFGFAGSFDYQQFVRGLSNLAFPLQLRTNENMRFIGRLYAMSGISLSRLRELVCQSIDMKVPELDQKKLTNKVLAEKSLTVSEEKSGYSVSPLAFLQSKQEGLAVSYGSSQILEYLINDTGLSVEAVNVLIEFVLENNQNKLSRSYVEKVAETFVRSGVRNEMDAKQLIKQLMKEDKRRNQRLRKIAEESTETVEEAVDDAELEAERNRLMRMFQERKR